MPGARAWMGELMLRAPAPLRSLRDVPLLGGLIHRLSHRVLPSEELVWAQVEEGPAKGIWLELNPRTGQGYLRGEVESAVQRALAERLRSRMTFYDLGANVGLFSLMAARIVGSSGRVVSFEPDPVVAARLRRNVERNGVPNMTVVEAGVWSSSGEQRFVTADGGSPDRGVGQIAGNGASVGPSPLAASATVRCVSLDDFVKLGMAPEPDAIKCDIEGAEVEALRGAEELLARRRAWIVAEMHSAENDARVREQLKRFGYRCEILDAQHLFASPSA